MVHPGVYNETIELDRPVHIIGAGKGDREGEGERNGGKEGGEVIGGRERGRGREGAREPRETEVI